MEIQQAIVMAKDLDYEAQHFGFHPRTFSDLAYNSLMENVLACINQLKQHLIQEFSDIIPPHVISLHMENMMQELITLCDKSIDKLEVYLNSNVFFIHPQAILPEDKIHMTKPCTKAEDEEIDKEIAELKQKILQEKAKRYNLQKTIKEQKQVKELLLNLHNRLKELLKIASDHGVNKESIESLYSKLSYIISRNPK